MAAFLIKHPGVDCLLLSNNCYHVTRTSEFSCKLPRKQHLIPSSPATKVGRGPLSPGNFSGPENIPWLFSLANKPVHFVSSSDSFMTLSVKLLKRPSWMSTTRAVSGIATFAKQASVQKKIRLKTQFWVKMVCIHQTYNVERGKKHWSGFWLFSVLFPLESMVNWLNSKKIWEI